jgi:hypothetical protein
MNDLLDRLARLDGSAPSPTDAMVDGDLTRAHAALGRRRRTRAAVAGAGLTLGVGAAFGVVAVVADNASDSPTTAIPTPSDTGRQERPALALVNYEGPQVEGFELAKVPEGYEIQGSDAFVLTLAKPGDNSHYLAFDGKVVIMLESKSAAQELGEGQEVTVDGEPGVLQGEQGETRNLRYVQGDRLVLIQVWETIELTDEQIVELAEAVTVTSDAEAGVG